MADSTFSKLSDDIVLQIFFQLQDDPRNWARLCCVSTKFNSLITSICYKSKCISSFHSNTSDLLSLSTVSGGGWASLYKISVCCPGVRHAGVLLDNSDFGLHRELGPTENYIQREDDDHNHSTPPSVICVNNNNNNVDADSTHDEFGGWSLYDDLYFDTLYNNSETSTPIDVTKCVANEDSKIKETESEPKRRKISSVKRCHLASDGWSLSREEGNKLLGSRFRDDCLYISEWPGCLHIEEKRNYRLFRGMFKDFKATRVWRTINDGNRSRIHLNCAFCNCKETWDLHSAFCLKRGFGFHDDGDPVVRAYVCENGHVSGAWTDLPFYL